VGFWPDVPDYSRMPGWPAIISLGIRLAPGAPPEAVSRLTNAVCLSLAGAFFCALSGLLGVAPKLSAAAGFSVSFSPALVALSENGMSEVSFVMIIAIGLTIILADRRWLLPGAFILGTATLVRTNFILVLPLVLVLAFLIRSARAELLNRVKLSRAVLACVLATTPVLLWAIRNAEVTGRFPYLCSGEGQLLYGGNNDIAANNLEWWGYWVMPELVPGEKPKGTLARELGSDLALDDYYHRKTMDWIRSHLSAMPRLELGKFVRAFVPVPFVPRPESYAVFFCRFLLYAFWFALMPYWRRQMNGAYLLFCLAMGITQIITTAMFYGIYRFTHVYIEVLFIPCIALGLQGWNARRVQRAVLVPAPQQEHANV
jgi:4-amino-4-deoxy-L-arabinose transferase-like glycosyltransferase